MKTLIYGVGNPYRCDDRAGIEAAQIINERLHDRNIVVKSGSIDGMAMLDELIGFDRVIFIDSIMTGAGKPGDIYRISVEQLQEHRSLASSHSVDFVTAVRLGKKFGYRMPDEVVVYAIEAEDNSSYREKCTEKIKARIPALVEEILEEINR